MAAIDDDDDDDDVDDDESVILSESEEEYEDVSILKSHTNKFSTRGYQKICGHFKYLLIFNVYCSEILSAYIVEYYQHVSKQNS
jgi:hypothetical protein